MSLEKLTGTLVCLCWYNKCLLSHLESYKLILLPFLDLYSVFYAAIFTRRRVNHHERHNTLFDCAIICRQNVEIYDSSADDEVLLLFEF